MQEQGAKGSLRYGSRSRRDPMHEQVASGPEDIREQGASGPEDPDARADRKNTSRDPRKNGGRSRRVPILAQDGTQGSTREAQVSTEEQNETRGNTIGESHLDPIPAQEPSGPQEAYDTGAGRVGTRDKQGESPREPPRAPREPQDPQRTPENPGLRDGSRSRRDPISHYVFLSDFV